MLGPTQSHENAANQLRVLNQRTFLPPSNTVITISEAKQLPSENVLIMVTGSQGEETSALAQIASGAFSDFQIAPSDTVFILSSFVPANMGPVDRMADKLMDLGATVTKHHSLPIPSKTPEIRKLRKVTKKHPAPRIKRRPAPSERVKPGISDPMKRSSSASIIPSLGSGIPDTPVMKSGYRTMKKPSEMQPSWRITNETKQSSFSPEGPYGSWGLSIPSRDR